MQAESPAGSQVVHSDESAARFLRNANSKPVRTGTPTSSIDLAALRIVLLQEFDSLTKKFHMA